MSDSENLINSENDEILNELDITFEDTASESNKSLILSDDIKIKNNNSSPEEDITSKFNLESNNLLKEEPITSGLIKVKAESEFNDSDSEVNIINSDQLKLSPKNEYNLQSNNDDIITKNESSNDDNITKNESNKVIDGNDYILTMKVKLDKNNMNDIIIPETVNVDKIVKMSRDKYLEEVNSLKRKELEDLKKEIHEINSNKFESIFKNLMSSYNSNFDRKIDKLFNNDLKQNTKNAPQSRSLESESNSKNESKMSDSDPFVMDYQMINKNNNNKLSESKSDSTTKSKKNKTQVIEKSSEFKDYFDCVYIINLPNERDKISNLTSILSANRMKYKIIDGIRTDNDTKYMKYHQRWLYQKNLDEKFLNKFIFDEKLYLKKNKDLVKLNNKSKLWHHWLTIGKQEQRELYKKSNIKLDTQLGNLLAHMNAIKDAKYEKYKRILILEDDVYIHKNYIQIHDDIISSLGKFNILFYGGIQKKWSTIEIENNCFYKANDTSGRFAYCINSNMYDILLDNMNELEEPFDKILIKIQNYVKGCYVAYPNIFITDLENGKIHRKRDLNKYSKHFKWKLENYKM